MNLLLDTNVCVDVLRGHPKGLYVPTIPWRTLRPLREELFLASRQGRNGCKGFSLIKESKPEVGV